MAGGIIILGAAGAGKTALGRVVAGRLGIAFLDIDDYIWRADTEAPFTQMYSHAEKIDRLMTAANAAGEFVMAGSMYSIHAHFDPMFRLAVLLSADAETRLERLRRREYAQFGARILPGGDMYEAHQFFLQDAAAYDGDAASCSRAQHEEWVRELTCPVMRLDGSDALAENAERIARAYRE